MTYRYSLTQVPGTVDCGFLCLPRPGVARPSIPPHPLYPEEDHSPMALTAGALYDALRIQFGLFHTSGIRSSPFRRTTRRPPLYFSLYVLRLISRQRATSAT